MPSIFDHRNSAWPNPEQSIGEECVSMGDLRIWFPVGPALAAYEILAKDLEKLLNTNKDASKEGEDFPRGIAFSMWMIGRHTESSNPTILFTSKSKRQRVYAKAMLKISKLLDDYPGFKIRISERKPARYQAGPQEGGTIEITCDSTDDVQKHDPEEAIYMVDDSRGSCSALIAFGRSRLATMGGTLLINGTYYGISAQHGRYKFFEEPEDAADEGNPWCFDDDSDTEDSDLESLVDITSRESISSFSDDGSSTVTFTSTTSTKDESPGYPIDFPRTTESTLDENPVVPSPSQPAYSSNPKISNLLPFERNDLDYEVFKIDDSSYHNPNSIDLPSSGYPCRRIFPNKVAKAVVECPVWAATGTTGCVQGVLMRQPHYIKMEGSETFQEMWAVKLDRNTKPGDSGAWVVDSAGQLFGHIVAGDPMLGLAFIIPAYKTFDDIKSRFGEEPLLCTFTSFMQPYCAPKDGKVAEQPLLDLIEGKRTVSRIWICGFPGIGKTGTADVVREFARKRFTSIGREKEFTREIAELRRLGESLGERYRTLEKMIADFMQATVQEVQHGREATCRGNILGTSINMIGTSNQLMTATFSATGSPPFASILPSISAYNRINHANFLTSEAAKSSSSARVAHDLCNAIRYARDQMIAIYVLGKCELASQVKTLFYTSILLNKDAYNHNDYTNNLLFEALKNTSYPAKCDTWNFFGPQMQVLDALDQDSKQRTPHCFTRQWILPEVPRLCPRRISCLDSLQAAVYEVNAGWLRHYLRESESGSGIVPIREARMRRQEPHPLDQYGNQWTPQWFTRRWALQDIRKLQPMRLVLSDSGAKRNILPLLFATLSNCLYDLHRRESGSAIVPIREARMQRQEPHPLDQHGNQYIPRFNRRRALQDIPKLQPMRAAVADSGAECNWLLSSQIRLCSLDLHPNGGLRIFRNLQRHESHRLKQIRFCYDYYSAHVLQSLESGAVPTYIARLSRRGQLNALRRRDDNSQYSGVKEWECHDWCLFSMALMVMGIDLIDPLLRHQIETYFQEYFVSALSGVTEGGFFVGRSGYVRRYGSSVGSRIGATSLTISRVGEDVL